jgi:hypothetical protein
MGGIGWVKKLLKTVRPKRNFRLRIVKGRAPVNKFSSILIILNKLAIEISVEIVPVKKLPPTLIEANDDKFPNCDGSDEVK